MAQEEGVVILEEEPIVKDDTMTEAEMADAGFLKEEIETAKKHNIIRKVEKDGEHKVESNNASKKDEQQVDKDKLESNKVEINVDDLDSFEKVHELFEKHPDKFRELPKNIKALYHNSKGLYKKAKNEEQKRADLEKRVEYDSLKNKVAETKVNKIREVLKKETLTVEDIESILGVDTVVQNPEDNEPKQKDDQQKRQADFIQSRLAEADKLGNTEYDNFKDIVDQAKEIIAEKPRQLRLLQDALMDEEVSERDIVEMVVDIARLHKDFGKTEEKKGPVQAAPTDEKVERMLKNSQKKSTSAALGGGGGSRTKSYDDLTAEDVSRMSYDEYKKLPSSVTRRLKEELD